MRDRAHRVEELFDAAAELERDQRARFVEEACGDDRTLRRRVQALLRFADLDTPNYLHAVARVTQRAVAVELPDPPVWLSSGATVSKYELIRPLGRGGMGTVFLARDDQLARLVAIKFLHQQYSSFLDTTEPHSARGSHEHFLAEARATAQCHHANIVVIHDAGVHQGCPYLVLEYLDGQTLREMLEEGAPDPPAGRKRSAGRPGDPAEHRSPPELPPARLIEIAIAIARALQAAHARGIVHCDLKPENIMLTGDGALKVLDFGVAQMTGPAPGRPTTTDGDSDGDLDAAVRSGLGAMRGTLPYMSPEQLGLDPIDHRSDLWALGIILYELATGHHPLDGVAELALEILDRDVPIPSASRAVPGPLGRIIDRCLFKRRADRTPSASALLGELEALRPGTDALTPGQDECPYPGLTTFQEPDAHRFFGRADVVAQLVARLGRQSLLAVVGPSGAGKSSVIRAGLLPALRRTGEGWSALIIRPGHHPLERLADAVDGLGDDPVTGTALVERLGRAPGVLGARLRAHARRHKRRVLVFVDQFEELYAQGCDDSERQTVLAALAGAADDPSSPVRVLLTLRSDFLHRALAEPSFATALIRGLQPLAPIGRDGLREALVEPLAAAGYRFESDALLDRMIGEITATPGALPLLQFTAATLWHERDRDRRLLTEASYTACGGVAGALAEHATAVIASLDPRDAALARQLFERLVTPARTRAVVDVDDLFESRADREPIARVLARLIDARLVTAETTRSASPDQPARRTVELAHESLIERWPLLRSWLDENQGDRAFLARVRIAARQWESHGCTDDLVWRGDAAHDALRWFQRGGTSRHGLGDRDQRYLQAIMDHTFRARRRRRRVLWCAAAAMVSFAAVVSLLAIQARVAARQAEEEALRARNASRISAVRALADPTAMLAILREIEPPAIPQSWSTLTRWALDSGVAHTVLDHPDPIHDVAYSPDGATIASGSSDGLVRVWRADGSAEPVVLRGHGNAVISVAFSPDGRRLISASKDRTARIWPLADHLDHLDPLQSEGRARGPEHGAGEPIVLRGHTHQIYSARFSPDGERVVTASWDHTARVWSADGRDPPTILEGHRDWVYAAAFSPDGQRVVTAAADHTARIWHLGRQDEAPIVLQHDDRVLSATFHPDGEQVLTGAMDGSATIWRADGSGAVRDLRGHDGPVHRAAFSPDGRLIVTASPDKTARVWSVDDHRVLRIVRGHRAPVMSARFSPDGQDIVTASNDTTVRIWRVADPYRAPVLHGHTAPVMSAAFSPDGARIITASEDLTARIWWADNRAPPVVLRGHRDTVAFAAFSPDGLRVVTASHDGTARVWRADGSGQPVILSADGGQVTCAMFDPGGTRVVTSSHDGAARVWNADGSGAPIVLSGHRDRVFSAAFSRDGERVVTASLDGAARVWNADGSGAPVVLRGHRGALVGALFSPDGSRVVTASIDRTARIWPADGSDEPVVLRGHDDTVLWAAFHLDGHRVVTSSADGTLRVWDPGDADRAPVVLRGHRDVITRFGFNSDGTRVVTASRDHTVRIWRDLEPIRVDDPRLWTATTYCMPVALRQQILNMSVEAALADHDACRSRVRRPR